MHEIFLKVLHIKYFKDKKTYNQIFFFSTTKRFNGGFNSCLEKYPTTVKVGYKKVKCFRLLYQYLIANQYLFTYTFQKNKENL